MSSVTLLFVFVSVLTLVFLLLNFILAPHNPYQEKYSIFECGFHSFLGQNRTQFGVKFFIFALVYLILDLEILVIYPFGLSGYENGTYGLIIVLIFIGILTAGFVFELGKGALKIDSRQSNTYMYKSKKFINTFMDLEPGAIQTLQTEDPNRPSVYPIGPIVRSSLGSKVYGSNCLTWLDRQPYKSVIFVSFGSGGTLTSNQLHELAIGLEKREVRFLWVIRRPNDESSFGSYYNNHDQDDIFNFLPKGFAERTKDRGLLVMSWAPQIDVLSHKSTFGFLTHCGWNSILESIVHAVPLIAWPLYAEQKMNAIILNEGLKVALRPKSNEHGIVEADHVTNVIKELMFGEDGKRVRIEINKLSESAKKAISNVGDSTKSLISVATKWTSSKV